MLTPGVLLATASSRSVGEVFWRLGALALLVVAGGVVIWLLSRYMRREETPPEGFSLQQLRELHASGALTDEEYERAKRAVIGRLMQHDEDEADESAGGEAGGRARSE